MHKIQQFIFPSIDITAPEDMYFRGHHDGATCSLKRGIIEIASGGTARFDTFFNSLSVAPWKNNCQIDDLNFGVTGKGRVRLRFALNQLHKPHRWLYETDIELSDIPTNLALDFWKDITGGMLYVEVRGLSDAAIHSAYFYTNSQPQHDVKLGIVITHFNRKHYVLPAIQRISNTLLNDSYYSDRVELIVVDNSQNILDTEKGKSTLIPSKNLGGSGGFTRGLLHLKDNNFSHCLFMDDDASCEMEAIRRTLHLLQFAKIDNLAVAGSMMREAEPFRIHEKGARIAETGVVNLKRGLDMRHVHDLLLAEEPEHITYGGWWHFAFRIKDAHRLSFPFFVRGDDMLFGLTNAFNIVTMNGIGGWADDFGTKESPINRYLSLRAHIMCLILGTDVSKWKMIRTYFGCILTSSLSYNYSGCNAFSEAVKDIIKGPSFWEQNVAMTDVRKKISQIADGEKCNPIEIPAGAERRSLHESKLRRVVRLISLNGFLLPAFLIKNKTVIEPKDFHAAFRRIFRYKNVIYLAGDNTGYEAHYDKKKFFACLFEWAKTSRKFSKEFPSLKTRYKKSLDYLTSEKFWRNIFFS
ncbi:hypothetical protein HK13_11870 [Acetobacter indonesiensis]|uniref:glycosyltransferase n=1 Tax=Acetobacter indonesiensis TaxID=104101 RepID=UPI000A363ABE|nr:glycosyltransferase [Acetobacter indonesiensis]OUI90988.1 hypothetical protein HK13_11870 [Acetobacter indonesiensis]